MHPVCAGYPRRLVAPTVARTPEPCYIQCMDLIVNGQTRSFAALAPGAKVQDLLVELALKQDRVAVEQNGDIVPRTQWEAAPVAEGDRFEIVHFVGGGSR
jgi:thiamine biosynthesis protein ThiS